LHTSHGDIYVAPVGLLDDRLADRMPVLAAFGEEALERMFSTRTVRAGNIGQRMPG
jgi:hypothetical protein